MTRRLEALSTIRKYVSKIDHPTLFIEESIYTNLALILAAQSKSLRFVEQNLKFDFKHPSEAEPNFLIVKNPLGVIHEAKMREGNNKL